MFGMDPLTPDVEILPEWRRAADEVLAHPGIVMVLGASDSGKTTLCRLLVEIWRGTGRTVGLVDADIGQASIGPPGTVGLVILPPAGSPHSPQLRFVGFTSPARRPFLHLEAIRTLVQQAGSDGAKIVVLDTTGMLMGGLAVAMKRQKLRALRPRHVLALEREGEAEPILQTVEGQEDLSIHRLPVSSKVVRRTPTARRAYREERYREYFASAAVQDFPRENLRFSLQLVADRISGDLASTDLDALRGAMLGLHDGEDRLLAVGILQDMDDERLRVLAPLDRPECVRHVVFGSIRLDAEGREIGPASVVG